MEADALNPEPLRHGNQPTMFDTKKNGALWSEEAVTSDDDHHANVPPPPSWWGWWWEVLSMAFSIGCMVAIVVVLVVFQDRPQDDWRGGWLSITATIAIFSTGAKSAAALAVGSALSQYKWLHFKEAPRRLTDMDLLEEASRGPLGSLALLAKRPVGLASIGAVVTLLAVGFDVFVQQMVTFESRDVAMDDGFARLGLAHAYDSGATRVGSRGGVINVKPSTMDMSMQGAVYRGLYNLGSPAVFNCTSSKCQWNGTYYSLGFTSTCADVTEATIRLHPNASATWNKTSHGTNEDMVLTTPGGVKLPAPYSPTDWQTVVSVAAIPLMNNTLKRIPDVDVNDGGELQSTDIARIGVFRAPVDSTNFFLDPETMKIFECEVSLAAYAYSSLSSSGQNLTIGKKELFRLNPGIARFPPKSGPPEDPAYITFNQSGLPLLKVSGSDLAGLILLFTSDRFGGQIYEGVSEDTPPQGMGDAFRAGDVSNTLRAMVDSMTDQLRSTYNVTVIGQTIKPVVYIQVQWAWISLPIVVELMSIAFFVAVLLQSARTAGLPLWKSSTVAVLTYDVRFREDENDVGKLGTGVRSMQELDALADSWKAKLDVPDGK